MAKKLPASFKEDCKEAYDRFAKCSDLIEKRASYVLMTIAKAFGSKLDWWDWENASYEGRDSDIEGHFQPYFLNSGTMSFHGEFSTGGEKVAIIKEGEWEFSYLNIPTRFLFEDFEKELKTGILAYQLKLNHEHNEIEIKKAKKKKLVQSAKRKLSKEEKEALGI